MARYVLQQKQGYYASLEVPKDLRAHFGKRRFTETLKTQSKVEAERRVLPIVARWKCDIEIARKGSKSAVQEDYKVWRNSLQQASQYADEGEHASEYDLVLDHLQEEAKAIKEEDRGQEFYKLATGQFIETLEYLDDWILTVDNTQKTLDMKRSQVTRFAKRFKSLQSVNKKDVRLWCDKLMQEEKVKLVTVKAILSACRGYWGYLQSIEIIEEDHLPFASLNLKESKVNKKKDERKPFENDEIITLIDAAKEKGDQTLADLIVLGMWTGARIDELCSLRKDQVKGDYIEIEDAKTPAGWRQVPIHSELKSIIQRLLLSSKDDFILSRLPVNKYGHRSDAIGKRFGRLKTELGFNRTKVFHSIRKTVSTQFENAGVAEGVAADIIGHDKPTMTYGVYSGGSTMETKRAAIEKLSYPE